MQAMTRQRPRLAAHHLRVSAMSALLARHLGLEEDVVRDIGRAGSLHDIGMTLLPDDLLDEEGLLGICEKELIHRHSAWAGEILELAHDPELVLAARVALQHHERWDGSGYPFGLAGEEICLAARIVAVCAVYDALRHPRPGKLPLDHQAAVGVLVRGDSQAKASAFDPAVRDMFVAHGRDFQRIAEDWSQLPLAA
jgi:putative two-component system response regulator